MLESLKKLDSYKVFDFFNKMNQIPRGSGNETAVSNWLVQFAKERGLSCKQDNLKNVIIKVPGTAGYEQSKTIVLQGHMDMVCEKEADSKHDFLKDPIAFIIDGDYLHADKTTLGADDGIAIAMALALADSPDIPHPPLEILATVSEETGMDGAVGLDVADISGRTLINIDSEEEGIFLVGCAGGKEVFLHLPISWENVLDGTKVMTVTVNGLQGGHSGMEISKERGNANKLLARVLYAIGKKTIYNLADIKGGSKHNAIPREASAYIVVRDGCEEIVKETVSQCEAVFKNELQGIDEAVTVKACLAKHPYQKMFNRATTENIVNSLLLTTHGVINMSQAIKGLVQTSNNLAIVETHPTEVIITCAIRSSIRSWKEAVADEFDIIAKLCGGFLESDDGYPEWQYTPNSPIRDTFVSVYKRLFGKEPVISAIHAGLECGLFSEKFKGQLDQISFGPSIYDVHTAKERVSISSVDRSWKFLKEVLKELN